jgi:hypothetical protein
MSNSSRFDGSVVVGNEGYRLKEEHFESGSAAAAAAAAAAEAHMEELDGKVDVEDGSGYISSVVNNEAANGVQWKLEKWVRPDRAI